MRRMWMGVLALVTTSWGAAVAAQGSEVAGYVLTLEGSWSLRHAGRPLAVGAAVPQGEQLVAQPPFERSRVVVVAARSGAVLLSHQCSQADCRQPVAVAAADGGRSAPSAWGDLLRTVMSHLEREPDRFVATISRGNTRRGTAVLAVADGQVDFAPLLAELPAGRYQGRLSRLICRHPPNCPETPLAFSGDWPAHRPSMMVATAADPGLYALEVATAAGRPARQAWVLLVRPADQAAAAERFATASRMAQGWDASVSTLARENFLLAALYALASP